MNKMLPKSVSMSGVQSITRVPERTQFAKSNLVKFLYKLAICMNVTKVGFFWPLQNEDHEAQAETILQLIRDEVAMRPCDERVGRMKWGIRRMIKRLEVEDTESGLRTAHHLWKIGHGRYPDYITEADKPKSR